MGYERHHCIIVSSWKKTLVEEVRLMAIQMFCGGLAGVTEIINSGVNAFYTFLIGPDGSKEGWLHSFEGDAARLSYTNYLDSFRYEDGSSAIAWVEVQFRDDNDKTMIVNHSDESFRRDRSNTELDEEVVR